MTAVIIDDAQNAIDALRAKLERHCPFVQVQTTFTDTTEALNTLPLFNPDVLFLDIEMPLMDGFEFLQKLGTTKAAVIFVTAYNHYAIQAIRASAFDYLEKPVDPVQLSATMKRLEEMKNTAEQPGNLLLENLLQTVQQMKTAASPVTLTLPDSEGLHVVTLAEIIRLESMSNYTKFYLADGQQIVVSKTMGDYEELLLKNNFFRVHRSHIINLSFLRHYHKNNEAWVEMKDGSRVDVSDRKRKELTEKLNDISGI
jgi:two-component system, LytTR family, response regulator